MIFSRIYGRFFNSLPARCLLCNRWQWHTGLCTVCHQSLPSLPPGCSFCGETITSAATCGRCQTTPPAFDAIRALWPYHHPLNSWISKLKSKPRTDLAHFFAQEMAFKFSQFKTNNTIIIPVPLHKTRFRERGFNQASLIAKPLATLIDLSYQPHILIKTKATPAQSSKSRQQRFHNLRGAFETKPNNAQHIVLVDDVVTTGSTVHEIARTIKLSHACHIEVWCVCRTLKESETSSQKPNFSDK